MTACTTWTSPRPASTTMARWRSSAATPWVRRMPAVSWRWIHARTTTVLSSKTPLGVSVFLQQGSGHYRSEGTGKQAVFRLCRSTGLLSCYLSPYRSTGGSSQVSVIVPSHRFYLFIPLIFRDGVLLLPFLPSWFINVIIIIIIVIAHYHHWFSASMVAGHSIPSFWMMQILYIV